MKLDTKDLSEKLARGVLDQAEADRGTLNLDHQRMRIRNTLLGAVEDSDPGQHRYREADVTQLLDELALVFRNMKHERDVHGYDWPSSVRMAVNQAHSTFVDKFGRKA